MACTGSMSVEFIRLAAVDIWAHPQVGMKTTWSVPVPALGGSEVHTISDTLCVRA